MDTLLINPDELTPVQCIRGLYLKREDLFAPFSYSQVNGGKLRQCLMLVEHINDKYMASSIKIPAFALKKYLSHLSNYTESEILEILKECIDIEESFKTGRLDEQIGIELLIIKICNKNFMIPN